MPYREETWNPTYSPKQFPGLIEDLPADIATIGLGDTTVGWLVRQEDALEWYTGTNATDKWRGAVRLGVEEQLRSALQEGHTALDAWIQIVNTYPVAEIEVSVPVREFYARMRILWDSASLEE